MATASNSSWGQQPSCSTGKYSGIFQIPRPTSGSLLSLLRQRAQRAGLAPSFPRTAFGFLSRSQCPLLYGYGAGLAHPRVFIKGQYQNKVGTKANGRTDGPHRIISYYSVKAAKQKTLLPHLWAASLMISSICWLFLKPHKILNILNRYQWDNNLALSSNDPFKQ